MEPCYEMGEIYTKKNRFIYTTLVGLRSLKYIFHKYVGFKVDWK